MSFLDETGYRHLYQKIVNKVQALWQKVGTATLTTNAQNTSEAINELKGTLDSLIGTGRIATTNPVTITPTLSGDVHIIVFGRKALSECCVYMYDFWNADFTLLAGSANHITLTKAAQSNSITVTSNTTNSIPYMIF